MMSNSMHSLAMGSGPLYIPAPATANSAFVLAQRYNSARKFPALVGSDRQIRWAEKIRASLSRRLKALDWMIMLVTDAKVLINIRPYNGTSNDELHLRLAISVGCSVPAEKFQPHTNSLHQGQYLFVDPKVFQSKWVKKTFGKNPPIYALPFTQNCADLMRMID
ncbi:MAG: hypothetical protein WCD70_07420 [Alphaproteobacteria bacterium]